MRMIIPIVPTPGGSRRARIVLAVVLQRDEEAQTLVSHDGLRDRLDRHRARHAQRNDHVWEDDEIANRQERQHIGNFGIRRAGNLRYSRARGDSIRNGDVSRSVGRRKARRTDECRTLCDGHLQTGYGARSVRRRQCTLMIDQRDRGGRQRPHATETIEPDVEHIARDDDVAGRVRARVGGRDATQALGRRHPHRVLSVAR